MAASRIAQEAREMSSFGHGVEDITEDFTAASHALRPGQLVKDDFFTLFEAVGALEIMDPKMDSGFVAPDDTFESGFDPCSELSAAEILWIMDQLLCLEITWHDGYPLSQTLYTSLHVDRLLSPDNKHPYTFQYGDDGRDTLLDRVLRPYCVALIKCCHLSLHTIQSQNFYEEEDFVTHLFGRELLPAMGASPTCELLSESVSYINDCDISGELQKALLARLQFRETYLQTLQDETNRWEDLITILKTIEEDHCIARSIPAAFSEKVQRQLATSTPPRPMIQVSFELACKKWTSMFEDDVAAHALIGVEVAAELRHLRTSSKITESPPALQRALWAFSHRQPSTAARAILQDNLFGNGVVGEMSHYDLMLTDIRDLVLAGDTLADPESFDVELPSDPRHVCSRLVEGFMDKAVEEYLNLYRMVCQNRCRIRRTFTQAIPILDTLESEALLVDEKLNKAVTPVKLKDPTRGVLVTLDPLTSWSKFYKLRIMVWTIQLGFETDIYLTDELGGMYWFLSHFSAVRCDLLDHIERFLTERIKSQSWKFATECQASQSYLKSLNASSLITRVLSKVLWDFFSMLRSLNVISAPKRDFGDTELLFEARMKSYLSNQNDPAPSLQDWNAATTSPVTNVDLTCKSIDDGMKKAKALLAELKRMTPEQAKYVGTEEEWKKEAKQMETTCVAVAVAASQLLRIWEKCGRREEQMGGAVVFGVKKYHDWWPVPQLSKSKK